MANCGRMVTDSAMVI